MSETRRQLHLGVFPAIGTALLVLGLVLLAVKAFSPEYVDAEGFLHESFFLLPCGFFCIAGGIVCWMIAVIQKLVHHFKHKEISTHED